MKYGGVDEESDYFTLSRNDGQQEAFYILHKRYHAPVLGSNDTQQDFGVVTIFFLFPLMSSKKSEKYQNIF